MVSITKPVGYRTKSRSTPNMFPAVGDSGVDLLKNTIFAQKHIKQTKT